LRQIIFAVAAFLCRGSLVYMQSFPPGRAGDTLKVL